MKSIAFSLLLATAILCMDGILFAKDIVFNDNFEDGTINQGLWITGGEKRGWDSSDPPSSSTGEWALSWTEVQATDGYLQGNVSGPESGATYGADVWVRTTYNLNDGKAYQINFRWEPYFTDSHYNKYFIQITDGYVATINNIHWATDPTPPTGYPGTNDFLWTQDQKTQLWSRGLQYENQSNPGPQDMYLVVYPSGIAKLFHTGDNLLIREEMLDVSKPWYIRFMVVDATSAGFSAGDASLKLYDFTIKQIFNDNFEDGTINQGLWITGGEKRGWDSSDPPSSSTGEWALSWTEVQAADGYLQGNVSGPESGMTYGADAWVRTTYNLNDGKTYQINFRWEPYFTDSHYNKYFIQITDGYVATINNIHWATDPTPPTGYPGTNDFLWTQDQKTQLWSRGLQYENQSNPGPQDMYLVISPSGVAKLYNTDDNSLIREEMLDVSEPWYIRFMVVDATSAGFSAGDASLKLYNFGIFELIECEVPTLADLNQDCQVNIADFAILASEWLSYGVPSVLTPSQSGLVGYWEFDENTGNIASDSALDNDGTINGAAWTSGVLGGALSFNGTSDYILVPDADDLDPVTTQEITITAWIKMPTYQASGNRVFTILAKLGNGYDLGNYTFNVANQYETAVEGRVSFQVYSPPPVYWQTAYSYSSIPLNQWVHVAVTHDLNQNTKFYINGVLEPAHPYSMLISQNIINSSDPVSIGWQMMYSGYFNGQIDNLRLYNKALTSTEIQLLASSYQ